MHIPARCWRLRRLYQSLVFLLFFAISGCAAGGGTSSIYQDAPVMPVMHRFDLSARQHLRDLSDDFSTHLAGADSGITVRPGEKVEIFANGAASTRPGQGLLGPEGMTGCHRPEMPEPALSCYAVIYSLGVHSLAGEVGTHIGLLPSVVANLFLGINAPDVSANSGAFQITVVIVPEGTFTGLWASPQQGFVVQGTDLTISAYVFVQDAILDGVAFTLRLPGRAVVSICQALQSGGDVYTCTWDLTANGEVFPNGQVTVGLSLDGSTTNGSNFAPVVNPDGVLTGTVTYVRTQLSENYAGYAATDFAHPAAYQKVSGRWTVPSAQCLPGEDTDASIWVGMTSDASDQSLLAQLGSSIDCQGGQPQYFLWWEMYPAPLVQLGFPLRAGDQVTASVTFGHGTFQLSLVVPDEGVRFSLSGAGKVSDTKVAECIVEPVTIIDNPRTNKGHLEHFTNFGQVTVHCQLNGNQPIAAGPQDILYKMQTNTGIAKAFTSVLDASGTTFTVRWHHE
jgi:hypothetical protein